MTRQSTPKLIPQDMFAFDGNQMMTEKDMLQSLRSSSAKRQKRAATESCDRTAEQLFDHLESFALAVDGNDLGTTEDLFEPTARCINDTKKRQLMTRSGLPSLRCCVSHIYHKCAMKPPAAAREFFKMVLQQVRVTLWLMSLREMPTPQHTSTTKVKSTTICTIFHVPSWLERCSARSIRDTHLKAGFTSIILPIIISSAPRSR